jgi:TetR/AcrR family transcriptional regulator, transcriptional repressor for nem operon
MQEEGNAVGRTKTYDRTEVIDRAMHLFWERGYHATSTRELAEAMGINAYSLYAEFESKEQLYDATMQRYQDLVVTEHFSSLEADDASLEHVEAVVSYFGGGPEVTASRLGCLACNAAIELAPTSDTSQVSTDQYMARVSNAFRNALANAQAQGRLKEGTPVQELAAFLTVTVTGMLVLIRAGSDPAYLRAAAAQTLERLHSCTEAGQS